MNVSHATEIKRAYRKALRHVLGGKMQKILTNPFGHACRAETFKAPVVAVLQPTRGPGK